MPFATKRIRDSARRRIAAQVRAGQPCALCHRPIDLGLKYPHPESFVVDHKVATSRLPTGTVDRYEAWQPAHNKCNRAKSNSPDGSVGRNSGVLG
jgi:5-methylcytosine-specific restriction endonuclease McrA